MFSVLSNAQLDSILKTNYPERFKEVLLARHERKEQALFEHMGTQFQNIPKYTLPELEKSIAAFTKFTTASNMDDAKREQLNIAINALIAKKENNDYCVEGTSDYEYKLAYEQHKNNFQWPNSEEESVRQLEEQELLNLINN